MTQLSAPATAQESGHLASRGETARQRVLRSSLRRDHMRPVAQEVFTDVGLPDDFVTDLRSTAGEVAKSIDDRKQHAAKRSGATAGIGAEEKRTENACSQSDSGRTTFLVEVAHLSGSPSCPRRQIMASRATRR